MKTELQNILVWFKANKLSLNISKTKWTLFHPSGKKYSIPDNLPDLSIDNVIIKRDTVTKFLGVYIDENLTWKYHIEKISVKILKNIGILYKSRHVLLKSHLKERYFLFIHNYLNYANIAWASTYKSKLASLYRHQKHAVRVIYFKDRFSRTKPLFQELKALSVYEINVSQILCFVYKCKQKLSPRAFHDIFTLKQMELCQNL